MDNKLNQQNKAGSPPPPLPPYSYEWWYEINGEQKGPLSKEKLHLLIRSGGLKKENLVWREGFAKWIPINDTELTSYFQNDLNPQIEASTPPSITKKNEHWGSGLVEDILIAFGIIIVFIGILNNLVNVRLKGMIGFVLLIFLLVAIVLRHYKRYKRTKNFSLIYYQNEFNKITSSNEAYKGKWNWTAFFFNTLWLFSKGCWSYALIFVVLEITAMMFFGYNSPFPFFLGVVYSLIVGLRGNWLYYNVKIKKIQFPNLF